MNNLAHLFKIGQKVRCNMDRRLYKGTVKEVYDDYIIVDIPEISDHCWFEKGVNIGDVYPEYSFMNQEKDWIISTYNENTADEISYFINSNDLNEGSLSYMYRHDTKQLYEMEITNIIFNDGSLELYDKMIENEDILLNGEEKYNADTSAEFITDDYCCLVWFKYK